MRKNSKNKINFKLGSKNNTLGIVIASLSAILIQILLTVMVTLFLLHSENISESYVMYFYFCSILPSFIGGFISSKLCTLKGIFCGLINALIHNFTLTIILLFVCNGNIRPDIGILYAVIAVFAVIGGIAGANTKRRK